MNIFSLEFAIEQFPEVLKVVPITLLIAVVAMLFGMIFGLLIAFCRIYKVPILNKLAILYVSFIRGTPILVQLYVFFYGVPLLLELLNRNFTLDLSPDTIPPLLYALIAYTVNSTAYQAEIIRAAIKAIDLGQMEAAYSIGMTTVQGLKRIIIPQAFVVALPNFGNVFIGLIKGTSLVSAVKVIEIMAVSKLIAGDGYRFLEMYLDASIIYWVVCFVCEILVTALEKRLRCYSLEMDKSLVN